MTIEFKSDFPVELVDHMGSDELICKAARVSTLGAASIDSEESAGLINFLMRNRHGTPFEHGSMMFRISCPIFVWREYMRHRIGFSYNEQSGRYMELNPVFYVPPSGRPLVQIGKAGKYEFVEGTPHQYDLTQLHLRSSYEAAWVAYQTMLKADIAKEVARMCLPVALYSTAYVTLNPRSMMNFLSLRTKHEDSFFPSYPMQEINNVANCMENFFRLIFPITHEAFCNGKRVAP
jgi:thymidylate synthase (FAD)